MQTLLEENKTLAFSSFALQANAKTIFWGHQSRVEDAKTKITAVVNEGRQFVICTRTVVPLDYNEDKKKLANA